MASDGSTRSNNSEITPRTNSLLVPKLVEFVAKHLVGEPKTKSAIRLRRFPIFPPHPRTTPTHR